MTAMITFKFQSVAEFVWQTRKNTKIPLKHATSCSLTTVLHGCWKISYSTGLWKAVRDILKLNSRNFLNALMFKISRLFKAATLIRLDIEIAAEAALCYLL